ncbi:MAG: M23 family metallopeptidase [Candidatus Merdivicinus sp.]
MKLWKTAVAAAATAAIALPLCSAAAFEPMPPPKNADFSPYLLTIPLVSPLSEIRLSSHFGWRFHPIREEMDFHTGTDLVCPEGTPVYATLSGTVIQSGWHDSYGYYLQIDHYNGFSTLYAHCSKLLAKKGDSIKSGEKIALSGQTGEATGPHLHFEVRMNGQHLNPEWLPFFSETYDTEEPA